MTSTPNPIDVHVGARLRTRRKLIGRSQTDLAAALGLTFQQVQKYERGSNRLSASKLYEAATFLSVNVSEFFEGLADTKSGSKSANVDHALAKFLVSPGAIAIVAAYPNISPAVRNSIASLIAALGTDEAAADHLAAAE